MDADAVTVMALAEMVAETVMVAVFVFVIVVRARVVVKVLVTVLAGQLADLMHPPGQTWLSAIRQLRGGGLIVQTGRSTWACTIIVMAASSAAIISLICSSW